MNIKDYLSYDKETGVFYWIKPGKGVKSNGIAGRQDRNGYITICFNYKHYLAHRLAWWWVHGEWPPETVDHKNMDKKDNRIDNLRLATRSQNSANTLGVKGSMSRFRGVSWHKRDKVWRAYLKGKHLGTFACEYCAALAHDEAAIKEYGDFARTNVWGSSGKYNLFYNRNTGLFVEM